MKQPKPRKIRRYRFISKNGTYKTRWRVWSDHPDATNNPTPHERKMLGDNYSGQYHEKAA